MNIQVLFFGITTDLIGDSMINLTVSENTTVDNFKSHLKETYPQLQNLDSYAIAVNENYADNNLILSENDVVAIIPPVSGG